MCRSDVYGMMSQRKSFKKENIVDKKTVQNFEFYSNKNIPGSLRLQPHIAVAENTHPWSSLVAGEEGSISDL